MFSICNLQDLCFVMYIEPFVLFLGQIIHSKRNSCWQFYSEITWKGVFVCSLSSSWRSPSIILIMSVVLLEGLTGVLFSRFPFRIRDYNKLLSLFPDMIESRLIDPSFPPPPPPPPRPGDRLVIAMQRRSISDDLIKRVAYEATAGLHALLHQQLPLLGRPPSSTSITHTHTHPTYPLLSPAFFTGSLDLLIITVIKEAMNRAFKLQQKCNEGCVLEGRQTHRDIVWNRENDVSYRPL